MIDYSIQFCRDRPVDAALVRELFGFLRSRGVQYKGYQDPGSFVIFLPGENDGGEMSGRTISGFARTIEEILDIYTECDLASACLRVDLEYLCDCCFRFSLLVIPFESRCLLIFEAGPDRLPGEGLFLAFVRLCKRTFAHFDFAYGDLRADGDFLPLDAQGILLAPTGVVNFYSAEMADCIGRRDLLSTPALATEELANGGVMVLVGAGPEKWCRPKLKDCLGFEFRMSEGRRRLRSW